MDCFKSNNNSRILRGGGRFDILKFVLAMFIVAMHSGLFPRWLLPVSRLAVPLFFMMTSYFFYIKLCGITSSAERRSQLSKFVRRNAQLYLFWSLVLSPLIVVIHLNWFRHGILYAMARILTNIFITGFFGASWFILASIYAVLIVFFLSKYIKNSLLVLIALLVYVLALLDSNYGGLLSPDAYERLSRLGIRWSLNLPAALIWVVIGKLFAEHPLYIPTKLIYPLLVLAFLLYYGEFFIVEYFGWSVHTDCFIMSIPLCVLIFASIGQANDVKCRISLWLRKSSIIVYCVHFALIDIAMIVSQHYIVIPKPILWMVVLFTSLGISALIIWLKEKKGVEFLKYAY